MRINTNFDIDIQNNQHAGIRFTQPRALQQSKYSTVPSRALLYFNYSLTWLAYVYTPPACAVSCRIKTCCSRFWIVITRSHGHTRGCRGEPYVGLWNSEVWFPIGWRLVEGLYVGITQKCFWYIYVNAQVDFDGWVGVCVGSKPWCWPEVVALRFVFYELHYVSLTNLSRIWGSRSEKHHAEKNNSAFWVDRGWNLTVGKWYTSKVQIDGHEFEVHSGWPERWASRIAGFHPVRCRKLFVWLAAVEVGLSNVERQ